MSKANLIAKWKPLLEKEGAPEIASLKRKDIVARLMENQLVDISTNEGGIYTDRSVVDSMIDVAGRTARIAEAKALLDEAKSNAEANGETLNESQMQEVLTEANIVGDHGYDAVKIASGEASGNITTVGPAVMGLARRAIANLIAFDICGVQPMVSSTGQVFTLRAIYGDDALDAQAREAFHPMYGPDASFSGRGATKPLIPAFDKDTAYSVGDLARFQLDEEVDNYSASGTKIVQFIAAYVAGTATDVKTAGYQKVIGDRLAVEIGEGMATSLAELQENFNGSSDNPWNEMSFRIDKQVVEAKARQLKAQYSIELAQDLRNVHGLDADSELSSILANEIMLEINREMILWINATAQIGKTGWTNKHGGATGVFNFGDPNDVRGARWAGESAKSMVTQIDKEAAEIGRQTGRGNGNFVICSRNVAVILGSSEQLISPANAGTTTMNTDTSVSVFAGVLAGKYRVYIDQYAVEDYFTVGYKGSSEMDAGIYYCPYVPLTPLRGTDPKSFQTILGFKTRYGVKLHPFADGAKNRGFDKIKSGMPSAAIFGKNSFFRRVRVLGA
ncbi:gp23 major head protein [Aeromonas phage 65]|uniref:Major capsid protein n=2 Tax=Ishigurovirus osborne TaxID=260149 RepID=A0A219YBU7_9CAUD|nr:major head protein [Aeromonas phage 65]ADQ53090.1 gp23 major head protein [Aeromonas phage 65]APU01468.1 major capsid protein [Aeromonas phage 65.2]